ncbi:MAG: glutamine--scyllo-inositol aminotransferase [Nitrospirales bacterium]|nr:MAG: glutamine--scyllo-inositol aminotransferase [Nitrospirales bacterium]
MNVPLLDLQAQHEPIYDEMLEAIEMVMRNNAYILGPEVTGLEKRLADYCQTEHAIGVSSGTDALLVSLMALKLQPGDEVITTAFSFFATAGCIARLGAKPIFVDIDPHTYNLNPALLEHAITSRTKAIIVVHLYGQCAEMSEILHVAERHGLAVVEDAAQAIGADYRDGRRAGSMGTLGCLSFFPSKNLGGMGDGGMVVTNDRDLADQIRILRVQGSKPKYYHSSVGGNFRLDALQAAILNVKLKYLDRWTRERQCNADVYEQLFQDSGLAKIAGVKLPVLVYKDSGVVHYHIYNQFIIRLRQRDALREYLKGQGVGCEVYYPVPFHLQECFSYLGYQKGDFPESESAALETIGLPIFPELKREQQQTVVEVIQQFYCDGNN